MVSYDFLTFDPFGKALKKNNNRRPDMCKACIIEHLLIKLNVDYNERGTDSYCL